MLHVPDPHLGKEVCIEGLPVDTVYRGGAPKFALCAWIQLDAAKQQGKNAV